MIVATSIQQVGFSIFNIYLRNSFEQSRNPYFDPTPATLSCGSYVVTRALTERYVIPELQIQNPKIKAVALEAISFLSSVTLSVVLCGCLGYRSATWIRDLTLYAFTETVMKVVKATGSPSLFCLAFLSGRYARNLLERTRNPLVDAVSLTVPSVLGLIGMLVSPKVASDTETDPRIVKVVLPELLAWAFTPRVCSLIGRKIVIYPTSFMLFNIIGKLRFLAIQPR